MPRVLLGCVVGQFSIFDPQVNSNDMKKKSEGRKLKLEKKSGSKKKLHECSFLTSIYTPKTTLILIAFRSAEIKGSGLSHSHGALHIIFVDAYLYINVP